MKPPNAGPPPTQDEPKHPKPLGSQQGIAEKSADNTSSVKARVDSQNLPNKPALHRQHTPNSSGRK